ncbi:cyclophilin-like fold protein [Leifsonia sp. NPDC080035]|uniref:Cyclophilin-like fold protein n=1 Tax=Leifsonia sp. NPDC080035 TaxID=3143936 RepID=A0AAU7GCM3_9MICO
MKLTALVLSVATASLLAGCATSAPIRHTGHNASTAPTSDASAVPTGAPSALPASPKTVDDGVVGTVIRFAAQGGHVDVTIDRDSPAVRDFVSMLPLTLDMRDFSGSEKIGYLPRRLDTTGSPGSEPRNGDFSYYKPWGNIIFYYDAPSGFSDDVLHLGTFTATPDELAVLEGPGVSLSVVR